MLFFPIAVYVLPDKNIIILSASGFKPDYILNEKLYLISITYILISIIAFLLLLSIFLYKNRGLQMRFCIFNTVLLIVIQLFIFWYAWYAGQKLESITNYKLPVVFPVVSAVLTFLAFRSIKKDDKLVRSVDRIR